MNQVYMSIYISASLCLSSCVPLSSVIDLISFIICIDLCLVSLFDFLTDYSFTDYFFKAEDIFFYNIPNVFHI